MLGANRITGDLLSALMFLLIILHGVKLNGAKLNDSRLHVQNDSTSTILKCDNVTKIECRRAEESKQPSGFIARTSDAIYKALSGVFSFQHEQQNELADRNSSKSKHAGQNSKKEESNSSKNATKLPKSSTRQPPAANQISLNATKPSTTPAAPATISASLATTQPTTPATTAQQPKIVQQNSTSQPTWTGLIESVRPAAQAKSVKLVQNQTTSSFLSDLKPEELYAIVNGALKSIYWLKDSIFLNRSTRVAPHEEHEAEEVVRPNKGQLKDGQATMISTDDVHLLCKLLHRHLHQNSTQLNFSSPGISMEPEPKPAALDSNATLKSAELDTYVNELKNLNELHERHLLESAFNYESARRRPANESVDKVAERLLSNLFNSAASRWRHLRPYNPPSGGSDYEAPASDEDRMLVGENGGDDEPFKLRVWRRVNVSPGHLHLIYWLAERMAPKEADGRRRFKLFGSQEANRLLERLDEATIDKRMAASNLTSAGPLVSSYKPPASGDPHLYHKEPQVPEEGLQTVDSVPNHRSGLQLLVDRLTQASFGENLHLYLIIFLMVLLAIILCFAVPMICCRWRSDSEAARLRRRRRRHRPPVEFQTKPGAGQQQLDQPAPKVAGHQDTIWRKLSNTTTTLTREQADEATLRQLRGGAAVAKPDCRQLEYYSIEDRRLIERRQMSPSLGGLAQTDELRADRLLEGEQDSRRQFSKSVQTFADPTGEPQFQNSDLFCRDRQRSSDTLSKSELVMVKEKMIPISFGSYAGSGKPRSEQDSDYVNRTAFGLAPGTKASYIDSSTAGSAPSLASRAGQRQQQEEERPINPVELPGRAKTRVQAIKSELDKLEQRDPKPSYESSSSTYRRYPDIA